MLYVELYCWPTQTKSSKDWIYMNIGKVVGMAMYILFLAIVITGYYT